ncbi:MAG: hypothetical protein MSA56_14930 [Clostridium sp.]|nr:hypothetical protein [Clostridium sp.]
MKKLLISSMAILTTLSLVGCDIKRDRGDIEMRVEVRGEVVKLVAWNGYKLKSSDRIKDDDGNIKVMLEFDRESE